MPRPCSFVPALLFTLLLIVAAATGAARDAISRSRPLVRGGELVSGNGKFALGFFQQADSGSSAGKRSAAAATPKWYLGIWFNTVSKFTPAWVANRETPLDDGAAAAAELRISGDGNLVVFDRAIRSVLWSTRANTTTNDTVAVLLGSGNLVLRDAANLTDILWQSFDHMTDTFLPGAKLGRNKVTGATNRIVSNKNSVDLAPGVYSGGAPAGLAEYEVLLVWNSSVSYWSTGNWNGEFFNKMPEVLRSDLFTADFVSNDQEEYFTYQLKNDTLVTRYVVDVLGQAKHMMWYSGIEDWVTFNAQPGSQCDVYAVCGPFTVCRVDMLPFCSCMEGFSVRFPEDWELGDFTGGCDRNIPLNCGNNQSISGVQDKFYAMANVRLPDNAKHIDIGRADECAQACLTDCACYAYSYNSSCNVWDSELLNVEQKYNGSTGEGILYLRLAAKELGRSKHERRTVTITLVTAATIFTLCLLAAVIIHVKRKIRHSSTIKESGIRGGIVAFRYKDLKHATKDFSEKLGNGGFGCVFKGVLPDSTVIAVKRLDGVGQGEKEFRAEVRSIGMIQHINLVKLVGFCCEDYKRLLVYEYMPNRSLDAHLFRSNGTSLSWCARYEIALGVARGLAYLHENCQECIIHCDIKPQNILLDESFAPKIADFGMAKFLARDFSRALTTVRGTIGYLAPEWISGVAISSKVDVYSYGMVLLEIIFGRRNLREYSSDTTYFPVQVFNKLLEANVQCLVDESIRDGIKLEEVERACRIAFWCIQDDESNRPRMGQVVQILEGLLEVDMPPKLKVLEEI